MLLWGQDKRTQFRGLDPGQQPGPSGEEKGGGDMNYGILSLLMLAVIVAIGFIRKVNLGFLALGAAFLVGTLGGMKASEITGGFSSSMFVTLVGVTFLFGMASNNGTLELFSKKLWLWWESTQC